MITADSPIVGRPTGSLDAALEYGGTDNAEYIREVWRLGQWGGLDPAVIVAQWAHETADGTSPRWINSRNPAGILIESDGDADPGTWTQTEAALIHVWMLAWLTMVDNVDDFHPAAQFAPVIARWKSKTNDSRFPREYSYTTVADLQRRYADTSGEPQAVWAWDERYTEKLIAKHRAIFGVKDSADSDTNSDASKGNDTVTDTLVFGNGVRPPGVIGCWWPGDGRMGVK